VSFTRTATSDPAFQPGLDFARRLDDSDPLAPFRERFELPHRDGNPLVYLAGNSLGPLPIAARGELRQATGRWADLAVDGWFEEPDRWYDLDGRLRPPLARLVGASPGEVAVMNGLTVNLHLALATFFRPHGDRKAIVIERPCFPSDRFAVETHLRWHGLDPGRHLLEAGPSDEAGRIDESDIEALLEARSGEVALVLVGGVNFLTGQKLDMPRIVEAGHRHGAAVGLDLAHAVGNVQLALHDWDVDFAVWCHYKYVNGGPGAPAGLFVHERHGERPGEIERLGGWWGNDPATRFRMQLDPDFRPRPGAIGWQLSTPPVLAMAPLGPALSLFEEAGMERILAKSRRLTDYLEWLIASEIGEGVRVITPNDPERRGAQISLRVRGTAKAVQERLHRAGIVGDYREPDVIRLAPAPLYNRFSELWRAVSALREALGVVR
jgi:kynureninase